MPDAMIYGSRKRSQIHRTSSVKTIASVLNSGGSDNNGETIPATGHCWYFSCRVAALFLPNYLLTSSCSAVVEGPW
jgi:hypothetical protein